MLGGWLAGFVSFVVFETLYHISRAIIRYRRRASVPPMTDEQAWARIDELLERHLWIQAIRVARATWHLNLDDARRLLDNRLT